MEESEYIFNQGVSLQRAELIIIVLSSLILICNVFRIFKIARNSIVSPLIQKNVGAAVVSGVLILILCYEIPNQNQYYSHLKKNLSVTAGTTIELEMGDGHNQIKYEYSVDGKSYIATCGYTYDGKSIENIKIPDGKYKVLYNKLKPEDSVMDFRATR